MPDKDITLGEVYRAVLSLKDEFTDTRRELMENHKLLRDEVSGHTLALAEERYARQAIEARLLILEASKTATSDPWARVGAGISALATGALTYWMSRGGG